MKDGRPEERKMEKTGNDLEGQKAEQNRDPVSHSFSYDGYEQLHDEVMDSISVSIQYSDYEETLSRTSQNNLQSEIIEKKMKISLSQEQLRLNVDPKNFLAVPASSRKFKSATFSTADKRDGKKSVKIVPKTLIEPKLAKGNETTSQLNLVTATPPSRKVKENCDEVLYAVPRRHPPKEGKEITTSSASLSPWKSVVTVQTSSTSTAQPDKSFKYPLSFYCKLCNNILSDPRTLDCLHSFCMQCLARLDASNDLQNNQFWRKISERSESSRESFFMQEYGIDKFYAKC